MVWAAMTLHVRYVLRDAHGLLPRRSQAEGDVVADEETDNDQAKPSTAAGNRWTKIDPPHSVPQPAFQRAAAARNVASVSATSPASTPIASPVNRKLTKAERRALKERLLARTSGTAKRDIGFGVGRMYDLPLALAIANRKSSITPPKSSIPWSAPDLLLARPDTYTLAGFAPRCSIGFSSGSTAASSSCGSTTPIKSGTSTRPCSRSSTACTGWELIGTKGRKWADHSHPIISRSGWIAIRRLLSDLLATGHAYYDYATTAELQVEREAAEREKRQFRYSRRFMAETPADRARFESEGRQAVVRLKMPTEGTLVLDDLVRGRVEFAWAREQDHVVQRTDGTCLYHLANVVDDHDFEITHVIRAEEHLSNTPRQVFIIEGLGYPRPIYAHLPFVAEPGSRNKLSKRKLDKYLKNRDFAQLVEHGRKIAEAIGHAVEADAFNPVIVDFYKTVGYLPEAIINYLALLGWSLDDKTEHFARRELIEKFSLERVNKAPASFDPKKLWAFEERYFRALPVEEKVSKVLPYLQKAGLLGGNLAAIDYEQVKGVVLAAGDRIDVAGDILSFPEFFVSEPRYDSGIKEKLLGDAGAVELLKKWCDLIPAITPFDVATVEKRLREFAASEGIKISDIIHPLRIVLTGKTIGLGVYDTAALLGRETNMGRIKAFVSGAAQRSADVPPEPNGDCGGIANR